jgi:microcystin-dependent protein
MSEPFIAEIKMFGGNFAPRGYAFCNGQLMSIAQNTALFSLLGTTYGGDGQTTFGLPDMRGRSPVQWGTGNGLNPVQIGEAAGAESVTILSSQMPIHNHTATVAGQIHAYGAPGGARGPNGNLLAADSTGDTIYQDGATAPDVTLAAASLTATATIGTAGGSQPIGIRSPYLAVSFIIALEGIFPSRN